jgi:hypothetical protein
VYFAVVGALVLGGGMGSEGRAEDTNNILQQVKQAAQEGTQKFYPRAEKRKARYGFAESDNLSAATLGEPVRLFFIDSKAAQAYRDGTPLTTLIQPSGQWFVPVSVGGTNRAMLGVVDDGAGHWVGATFGMAPLARAWQRIQERWPASNHFTPELLICPPTEGYYLTVPQVDPPNLTPLTRLFPAQGEAPPALMPVNACLSGIQTNLNNHP